MTFAYRSVAIYFMLDRFQVDSYGHFFRVVRTKVEAESLEPAWNQEFMVDLEGSENLRLLVYQVPYLSLSESWSTL